MTKKETTSGAKGAKTTKKSAGDHAAPRTPKKKRTHTAPILAGVLLIALLCATAALGAIHVQGLETIYPNVRYAGVDVGGMTVAEAGDALEEAGYGARTDALTVALPLGHTLTIDTGEAVQGTEPIEMAARLYDYGREGNLAENLITYLRCRLGGYDATAAAADVDADYVRARVNAAVQSVNAELMGASLEIGETEIRAVKGAKSALVDEAGLYALVMNALTDGETGSLSYAPAAAGDDEIDLQAIYDTVYREAKNAEYDPETRSAGPHVEGVSFDLEAARRAWNAAGTGERVIIPLELTVPEITTETLNSRLFADVLSEKSTSLAGSSSNRINNVKRACASIDGVVLNPGESFSYNAALGKRTTDNGYLPAGAYSGGEVVTEIGGGICQVSSTLYWCTLHANLEITARTCHYFAVNYITPGLDATVSWGGPEFKFVNDRSYPVKIQASADNASCSVRLLGTDTDGSTVQMTTKSWINADGSTGVTSYRNVYDRNGVLLSTVKESDSRYHLHEEKKPEETESPEESEKPEESAPPEESGEPILDPATTQEPENTLSPSPASSAEPAPSPSAEVPSPGLSPVSGSDIA